MTINSYTVPKACNPNKKGNHKMIQTKKVKLITDKGLIIPLKVS